MQRVCVWGRTHHIVTGDKNHTHTHTQSEPSSFRKKHRNQDWWGCFNPVLLVCLHYSGTAGTSCSTSRPYLHLLLSLCKPALRPLIPLSIHLFPQHFFFLTFSYAFCLIRHSISLLPSFSPSPPLQVKRFLYFQCLFLHSF